MDYKTINTLQTVIFNSTYEHGKISILEMLEANANQYEVKLQHNDNTPEWYYIDLNEETICTIDIDSRERGELFDILFA